MADNESDTPRLGLLPHPRTSSSTGAKSMDFGTAVDVIARGGTLTAAQLNLFPQSQRTVLCELLTGEGSPSKVDKAAATASGSGATPTDPVDLTSPTRSESAQGDEDAEELYHPLARQLKGDTRAGAYVCWCFTIFPEGNFLEGKDGAYAELQKMEPNCKWLIAGWELSPKTKKWHYQGYLQLLKPARKTALKKAYHGSIHWEAAGGTPLQNYEYSTKTRAKDPIPNEEVVEFGTRPKFDDNGKREKVRWEETRAHAIAGDLNKVDPQIFVCHYGSLRSISKDYSKRKADLGSVCGFWFYGAAGTGKSYTARNLFPDAYDKQCNKWFDGFVDQSYVLIDDFGTEHAALGHHLKIWADRYSFMAEIKGGQISIRPAAIIVTSQYHPREIWQDFQTLDAILRRFELRYFTGDNIEITPRECPTVNDSVKRYQEEIRLRAPGSSGVFNTPPVVPRVDTSAPTIVVNPPPVRAPDLTDSPSPEASRTPAPTPSATVTTGTSESSGLSEMYPAQRYSFPVESGASQPDSPAQPEPDVMAVLRERSSTAGMQ